MSDIMGFDIQVCQLPGRDATECHNFLARKQVEESFKHWQADRAFGLSRDPVTQHAAMSIETNAMGRHSIERIVLATIQAVTMCSKRLSRSARKNRLGISEVYSSFAEWRA